MAKEIVMLIIFFILQGLCIILYIRNELLGAFRLRLLDEIHQIARDEVALKLLKEEVSVSYEAMLFQFWRPFKSFYSEELMKLLE